MRRLVAKELVDNALDVGVLPDTPVMQIEDGVLRVTDAGPGIDGTPAEIAALFSIARPLSSSKQLRLPTRGALGNGLRVVVGYTLATEGTLKITTRGHALHLQPCADGTTAVLSAAPSPQTEGTTIEVHLGSGYRFEREDLSWARIALMFTGSPEYAGKSSPHWYDEDAFFELCQAYGNRFARDLVAMLDGCANPKAGRIARDFAGRAANSLTREEVAQLLAAARDESKPVKPKRLGVVGRCSNLLPGYATFAGTFEPPSLRGRLRGMVAAVPFVLECWAEIKEAPASDDIACCVNRTLVAGEVRAIRQDEKTELGIIGCGLKHAFRVGRAPVSLMVNIQTPYMPITSEGKAPDFEFFLDALADIVPRAANSAKNKRPRTPAHLKPRSEAAIIRDVIDAAAARASDNGASRYSVRQLFYQVRPFVLDELGKELKYENFNSVLMSIEDERGHDLPGIYRDARGILRHPHTGEETSLGTLQVEQYSRPDWNFNKVLYIEKEGFFQLLVDARWPERHDCALLTSKGFATRAARDMIDLLGDTAECLDVFCVHDADAAGTLIHQGLQEATKARPARRVQIVNLGLEPEEGLDMGLDVEHLGKPKTPRTVAGYVSPRAKEWLQTARIELNAMTTARFIQWLDTKMMLHNSIKLVPPRQVLEEQLQEAARQNVEDEIKAQVLKRANIEKRVEREIQRYQSTLDEARKTIAGDTRTALHKEPAQSWGEPIKSRAAALIPKDEINTK